MRNFFASPSARVVTFRLLGTQNGTQPQPWELNPPGVLTGQGELAPRHTNLNKLIVSPTVFVIKTDFNDFEIGPAVFTLGERANEEVLHNQAEQGTTTTTPPRVPWCPWTT